MGIGHRSHGRWHCGAASGRTTVRDLDDDDELTSHLYFKSLPPCTQECICELDARRELGGGDAARAQRERRASEIMAERLQANEFYTLYGVEFVDYDEKLYMALVASGASNGRVDIDDVKLGPL